MKLAEALIRRADIQKRIEFLRSRIDSNIIVQEGTEPAESPSKLIKEFLSLENELKTYIQRINKTNNTVMFDENRSISDVIVERESIMDKRNMLAHIVKVASDLTDRYSTKEIRNISVIDVKSFQKEVDRLSKEYRELDIALQGKNWEIELI